jgi:hypothetical protein
MQSICQKRNARNSASMYVKAQNSCMHALPNLANGACSIFDKLRVRNCQSIKIWRFFKIKNSTNQIRDLFLLVNMGACRHCIDMVEFNNFVRVQY